MLRRRLLVLALCLAGLTGLVYASDTPSDKITSHARLFSPTLSESRIAADIYYLSSEECEGRGSTTQGIHKAADYIVKRLQEAGLQPAGENGGFFQYFDFAVAGVRLGPDSHLSLRAGDSTIDVAKGDFEPLGIGTGGKGEAGLAFVGYGISSEDPAYDDYQGMDVAGKVVIVLRKTPRASNEQEPNFKGKDSQASFNAKVRAATRHKAAAVLFVNDSASGKDDALPAFNIAGTRAERGSPPVFQVKRAVVDQILTKAGMKPLADLEKQIDADFKPASKVLEDAKVTFKADVGPIKLKNILATVPGTGELADEVVVVGSHYDHVGRGETGSLARSKEIHPGADDNGSGSVTNLEIARRWQELQNGPNASKNRRRVVFQWYAAEEWGLVGSRYYCSHPLFPLDKTAAMLNMDMVGRLGFDMNKVSPGQDPEDVRQKPWPLQVIGSNTAKEFEDLVRKANKDLNVEIDMPKASPYFGSSDHYSYYQKNVPVLFFFTDVHPQYHRPTDTFQTVNIKGMRQVAELGQNVLEEMATMSRPAFIKANAMLPRRGGANEGVVNTGRAGGLGIMPGNYNDSKDGVLIDAVTPNRAAAKAGIKPGDRLMKINGVTVKNMTTYNDILRKAKAGDKLQVELDRKGEKVSVTVTYEGNRTAPPK